MEPQQQSEQPTKHAFVVFGTNNLYLAHSAMFMMPEHAYQVIREVDPEQDLHLFLSLRSLYPQGLILALSETPKLLDELLKHKIDITLHLNALGNSLPEPVTLQPRRQLYYKRLDQNAPEYPDSLTYFMFGQGGEVFMSHLITKWPNFHHEVTLTGVPQGVSAEELENGFMVTVPGIADGFHSTDPLPNKSYTVRLPSGRTTEVEILRRDRFTFEALNG